MDPLKQYRQIIQEVLTAYYQVTLNIIPPIERQLVFDPERDHYLLMNVGWYQEQRMQGCVIQSKPRTQQRVRGFTLLRKDKHMQLKNWRRTLLLVALVLAACGTADTTEQHISDSGVVASTTPDGAYPPPARTPAASPATQPIPTATSEPTTAPTLAATEDIPTPQPTERAPETAERKPTTPQTTIFYEQTTAVMTPTTVVSIEENESPLKLFAWSFDSQYLFFGQQVPSEKNRIIEFDLYTFDIYSQQKTFIIDRIVEVIPSPTTHEYILIQQHALHTPNSTRLFDILLWSMSENSKKLLHTITVDDFHFNSFVWHPELGFLYQDKHTGDIIRINLTTDHRTFYKKIPDSIERQFPATTWKMYPAPEGDRSYITEMHAPLQPYTIVLLDKDSPIKTLPFNEPRTLPQWSPSGMYLSTYNMDRYHLIDLYTSQGAYVYQIKSSSGVKLKTWRSDEQEVIVMSYGNGWSHPSTSFLINLEQETSARLNFEGVPDYAYTDTILWSPSDTLLAVDYTARNFRPENTPFFGLVVYAIQE